MPVDTVAQILLSYFVAIDYKTCFYNVAEALFSQFLRAKQKWTKVQKVKVK